MAIEVLPDSPTMGMSPRISFSHDLAQCDVVPVEQYIRTSSSSAIDFDFCVFRESFDQESSSADELFFDGKILPFQIKKRLAPPRTGQEPPAPPPLSPPPAPAPPPPQKPSKSANKETKNANTEIPEEKHKSFWRFKRSTSLNCGSGYGRTFCPLPLLSRSNSTGSSASVKRSSIANNQKQNLLKHSSLSSSSHKQAQSAYSSRPPLKKNGPASYGNGIKFNPILNVPPANLFGLGSIFSGGKDRSKKKY